MLKSRSNSPVQLLKHLEDVFTFGKHKGETLEEVIDTDPGYVLWCQESGTAKVAREYLDMAEEADRWRELEFSERTHINSWDFWGIDISD